jgi:hypothetical protein
MFRRQLCGPARALALPPVHSPKCVRKSASLPLRPRFDNIIAGQSRDVAQHVSLQAAASTSSSPA